MQRRLLVFSLLALVTFAVLLRPQPVEAYTRMDYYIGGPAARLNGMVYDGRFLWIAGGDPNSATSEHEVYKINPQNGAVVSTVSFIDRAFRPHSLLYDGTSIWVEGAQNGVGDVVANTAIGRINPSTNAKSYLDMTGCPGTSRLAFDGIYLYSYSFATAELCRYRTSDGATSTIATGHPTTNVWDKRGVLYDGFQHVWVGGLQRLIGVNTGSFTPDAAFVGGGFDPITLATDGTTLYASMTDVARINPQTLSFIIPAINPGGAAATDLAYDDGYLWIATGNEIYRVALYSGATTPTNDELPFVGTQRLVMAAVGDALWAAYSHSNAMEPNLIRWGVTNTITIGPIVQAVGIDSVTINWTTAENADSQLYYTATPLAWQQRASGTMEQLAEVTAASRRNLWAVGNGGTVLRSTNGGLSWDPRFLGFFSALRDVFSLSPSQAWIAGTNGSERETIDLGTRWWPRSPGGPTFFNRLRAFDSLNYWAAGADQVRRSADGGQTWVSATGNIPLGTGIRSLEIVAPTAAWVGGSNGFIARTINGGATWFTQSSGIANEVLDIDSFDPNVAWAVGSDGKIVKTTNGGTTWTTQYTGAVPLINIDVVSASDVWVVGDIGVALHTTNGGTSWTNHSAGGGVNLIGVTAKNQPAVTGVGDSGKILQYVAVAPSGYLQPAPVIAHSMSISGTLAPNTTYNYFVCSRTTFDTQTCSSFGQFTTLADVTPPTVSIILPPNNTHTPNPSFPSGAVTGAFSDNTVVTGVAITVNGNPGPATVGFPAFPGPAGTWQTTGNTNLNPGVNTIRATATDLAGLTAFAQISVVYDTTDPSVAITSHTNGQLVNASPINLAGTASDPAPGILDRVEVCVNANPCVNATIVGNTWTQNNVALPLQGPNTIRAVAYDRAGRSRTAQIQVTLDSIAPTATITQPPGNPATVFTPTVNLAGAYSDPAPGCVQRVEVRLAPAGAWQNAVIGGCNGNWTFANIGPLNPGNNTVEARAYDGINYTAPAASKVIIYVVPDYTLAVNPLTQSVQAGNSTTFTVTAAAIGGFATPVSLSLVGNPVIPAGVTSNFSVNPIPMPAGGNSTLTVNTQLTTPPGNYGLTVRGNAGGNIENFNITLNVTAGADFTIAAAPPTRTIEAGQGTNYVVTLIALNGFNAPVALSLAGLPALGTSYNFSQPNVVPLPAPGVQVTLSIQTSPTTPPCNAPPCTLTVTGTGGGWTHTAQAQLTINPDTTPPQILGVNCTPTFDSITVDWQTDEGADALIEWGDQGPGIYNLGNQGTPAPPWVLVHQETVTGLQDQTMHFWRITSRDQANNAGTAVGQCQTLVAPDLVPPTVSITSPLPGQTIGGLYQVIAEAGDNRQVNSVEFFADVGSGSFSFGTDTTGIANGPNLWLFEMNFNTNAYPDGTSVTLTAVADDLTFRTTSPPVTVTINNISLIITQGPTADVQPSLTEAYIRWETNLPSTSQVDYCRGDSGCPPYTMTETTPGMVLLHEVFLQNLQSQEIYHYRVKSCDGNVIPNCVN